MNDTITAIETIALRIPLDIWAPAPMSQGAPRTHVESLYVRVTTNGGTLKQGSTILPWDDHGYYEVSLDAGSLTLSAQ